MTFLASLLLWGIVVVGLLGFLIILIGSGLLERANQLKRKVDGE